MMEIRIIINLLSKKEMVMVLWTSEVYKDALTGVN